MTRTCRNVRCFEDLRDTDRWARRIGLCPSCRVAVKLGLQAGCVLAFVVATVISWIAGLLR